MKPQLIKTHNLIEFFAAKNELISRGYLWTGSAPSSGINIIKTDDLTATFCLGTYMEWINSLDDES